MLEHGVKKLIIGIGGSATNDGGVGLAQALGVKFLNKQGQEIGFGGGNLFQIEKIDTSGLITQNQNLKIEVACDVTNPLNGETGASKIYGPQKGATAEMVLELDSGLTHYATKIKEYLGKEIAQIPGAGAAGGAGAGLMTFLDAKLVKGIDLVIKHAGLEEKVQACDFIFTGEGSLDEQTAYGKTISGVLAIARKYQKPVIAFAGRVADTEALFNLGLTAAFSIVPGITSLEEALKTGKENLENTVRSAVQVIKATTDFTNNELP